MAETLTGGCLCGALRFALAGAPGPMVECHCSDCRKIAGGGAAYLVAAKAADFTITSGAPASHTVTADSGARVTRHFCADCGAPLYSTPDAAPGNVYIKVGAFDDFPAFRPQVAVWTASAPPWHAIPEDAARFERNPHR